MGWHIVHQYAGDCWPRSNWLERLHGNNYSDFRLVDILPTCILRRTSPSLPLYLPPPPHPSLCLSVALTRKHTYTLSSSLYLLPSSSVTHSAMSLPRSLTCSLELHPHLYSFRLRLTTSTRALRFSSFLPPKERTDFGIRHGVSPLNSFDTILFGHFSIRSHNSLRYWVMDTTKYGHKQSKVERYQKYPSISFLKENFLNNFLLLVCQLIKSTEN